MKILDWVHKYIKKMEHLILPIGLVLVCLGGSYNSYTSGDVDRGIKWLLIALMIVVVSK